MKICTKCNLEKDINEFSSRGGKNKHLYSSICKSCKLQYDTEYRKTNEDKIKENRKEYCKNNKSEIIKKRRVRRISNREQINEYEREYRRAHREQIRASRKKHYISNSEKIIKRNVEYRRNNEKASEYQNSYSTKRSKVDVSFKLRRNFSNAIYVTIKSNGAIKNNKSILKYLPYTIAELRAHLEKQFADWMNWANHGKYDFSTWDDTNNSTWTWHIDHIIPQSLLPYSTMEDDNFKKCWALDNLRPLSAKENIKKGNKI